MGFDNLAYKKFLYTVFCKKIYFFKKKIFFIMKNFLVFCFGESAVCGSRLGPLPSLDEIREQRKGLERLCVGVSLKCQVQTN